MCASTLFTASSFEACKSSSLFFIKLVYHSSNFAPMRLLPVRIICICMRKCRLKQQQKSIHQSALQVSSACHGALLCTGFLMPGVELVYGMKRKSKVGWWVDTCSVEIWPFLLASAGKADAATVIFALLTVDLVCGSVWSSCGKVQVIFSHYLL